MMCLWACTCAPGMRTQQAILQSQFSSLSLNVAPPLLPYVQTSIRKRYADWQYRNPSAFFSGGNESAVGAESAAHAHGESHLGAHWRTLERYFLDCAQVAPDAGACFNWEAPHWGVAPTRADAAACRVGGSRHTPSFSLEHHGRVTHTPTPPLTPLPPPPIHPYP